MAAQNSLRNGPSGQEAFLNLLRSDDRDFFGYLRMEEAVFDMIVQRLTPYLSNANPDKDISPTQRVLAALRFFVLGQSLEQYRFEAKMSVSSLQEIIKDVCVAIICAFSGEFMKNPRTRSKEDWVHTGRQFHLKTRFANCLGAIAGKHFSIISGSEIRNPKGIDSIILLAAADSNFEFIFAECGSEGGTSVASTFLDSELYDDLVDKRLNIPVPDTVERYPHALPYCFVSGAGYPSLPNVIQPYPQQGITPAQRHYNKLHCKAMRFIESAFAMITKQFGVLQRAIADLEMEDIQTMMLAICVLHNVLMRKSIKYKKSMPGKVAVAGGDKDSGVGVEEGGGETRNMHLRYANSRT